MKRNVWKLNSATVKLLKLFSTVWVLINYKPTARIRYVFDFLLYSQCNGTFMASVNECIQVLGKI